MTSDKVIAVALAEVGYLEKSAAAYKANPKILNEKTAGAGSDNYTKYGKVMHDLCPSVMDFPAYWCDAFVDWCFYTAYGDTAARKLLGGYDDYTKGSISKYQAMGGLIYRGKGDPKPGDQVFFTSNGALSGVHHTGLVVDVGNGQIVTVEGNTSSGTAVIPNGGAVCKKAYAVTDVRIFCYGRPAYEETTADGFRTENGKKYYYESGKKLVKAWKLHGGHWYRLGNDGAMLTGWHQIADSSGKLVWCYFEEKDAATKGAMWHERADHKGYLELWTVN